MSEAHGLPEPPSRQTVGFALSRERHHDVLDLGHVTPRGHGGIFRGARTSRRRPSAIRTGTVGSFRRSRTGSRAGAGTTDVDIASLADLLHETSEHHGLFEAVAPPHDWWDWYAAYLSAREQGLAPDEADAAADRYMAEVKNVVGAATEPR